MTTAETPNQTTTPRDWTQVDASWRPFADNRAAEYQAKKRSNPAWYGPRANALRMSLKERAAECGSRFLVKACGSPRAIAVPLRCGLWRLCKNCESDRKRSEFTRIKRAMVARFGRPGWSWTLVTMSGRSTGDPAADLDNVVAMRETMMQYFRTLTRDNPTESDHKIEWVSVVEWTSGTEGQGHVHTHTALYAPERDPEHPRRRGWWQSAWDYHAKHVETKHDSQQMHFNPASGARSDCASYLSKHTLAGYLADCGSESPSDELYGRILAATHGRRIIQTSAHFWVQEERSTECECCGEVPRYAIMRSMPRGALRATRLARLRIEDPPFAPDYRTQVHEIEGYYDQS